MRRCAWSAPRLAMPALPCAAWSSGRSRGALEHDADAARAPASSAATRQRCYVLPGAAGCCADEQLSLTRETSTHGSPRPLGRWWRRPTSRCRHPSHPELLGGPHRRPAPCRPRARAAAGPAIVRSRIRSLSHSAGAPNKWKVSLPPGVPVSMLSVRDRNATPRRSRSLTTSIRWRSDRPSRSGLHTVTLSPTRSGSIMASRAGRCCGFPETRSTKTLWQPAAVKVSCCKGLVLLEGGDAGVAEAVRGARILTTQLGIKYDVDDVFDCRSGGGL